CGADHGTGSSCVYVF
nr:immunoglobulin light chain junction region [Macaca mulatta]MPO07516.1 immunoglobulin light chain junction region [Macaca mulatta]